MFSLQFCREKKCFLFDEAEILQYNRVLFPNKVFRLNEIRLNLRYFDVLTCATHVIKRLAMLYDLLVSCTLRVWTAKYVLSAQCVPWMLQSSIGTDCCAFDDTRYLQLACRHCIILEINKNHLPSALMSLQLNERCAYVKSPDRVFLVQTALLWNVFI